jgi:CelD/BcsL family acetyltransferase involved in cellulose biosynthesis
LTVPADIVKTSIVTRFDAFMALEPEWTGLFEAAADAPPALRHHWLALAWRNAERHWMSPIVVLVRRNGRLAMAGAFALGVDRFKPSIEFLKASLPSADEVLWRASLRAEDDAVSLLEALRSHFVLPRIMRHGRFIEASPLLAAIRRLGLPHQDRAGSANHALSLKPFDGFPAYLDHLGRNLRHDHRRRMRRLEEAGPFTFRREQGESARPTLAWLLDIKRRWLDERHASAPWLSHRRVDQFLDDLLFNSSAPPWSLWTLALDGNPLAAQLSFEERNSWHFQMVGHDPAAKHFAPGRTVILLTIEQGFAAGIRRINLGRAGSNWKDPLVNVSEPVLGMKVRLK